MVKEVRLQANDLHALNANDCKNGAGSSQFIVDSSTLLFYKPKNQVVSTELQITGINSKQNLKVIASMIDRVNDSQNPLQSGVVLDNINDNYGTKNKTDIKLVNAIKPRDLDWYEQSISLRQLPKCYMMLSKIKLTGTNMPIVI